MDSEAETGGGGGGGSGSTFLESGTSFKSQRDVFRSASEGARRPAYLERGVCVCVFV